MNNLTSYSFFKLIKKLEKDYGRKNIFLRTNKSLKHPNKDIEKIIFSEHEQSVIELFINFMGLHGVSSQLPSFMLDKLSRTTKVGLYSLISLIIICFGYFLM